MNEFLAKLNHLLKDFDSGTTELNNYLTTFVCSKGKRIRPLLAFLCIKAHSSSINIQQFELIAAGELLHSASLIHDDIIDNASYRRELETLHMVYDSKLAVIAGDFLAATALNKILQLKNFEILECFHKTFSNMCKAEIQQYYNRGEIISLNEYIIKTKEKTADLFASILKGVGLLSDLLPTKDLFLLGIEFGTAFQIRNDLNGFKTKNSEDKFNQIYTAPDIFYNETKSIELAIEKTENLIDNKKQAALLIVKNFPQNIYTKQLIDLIEGL